MHVQQKDFPSLSAENQRDRQNVHRLFYWKSTQAGLILYLVLGSFSPRSASGRFLEGDLICVPAWVSSECIEMLYHSFISVFNPSIIDLDESHSFIERMCCNYVRSLNHTEVPEVSAPWDEEP